MLHDKRPGYRLSDTILGMAWEIGAVTLLIILGWIICLLSAGGLS